MILVTGASGFVGRHVVRELARDGVRVRAMVRTARGAATLEGVDCELVRGDVTDPASLRAAARGVRTIVHLVAIVEGSPATFERVMATGTGNLVEAARESGVRRIVLISALGTGPGATVPYFRAKWAAEQAVGSSGVDNAVLRPSFVFGMDGGALPRFVRIARLAPVTPVIGPGTQRVQPIWIDDLVRAVRLGVEGEGTGEPVQLGGPEAVTWSDLWRRLKVALGTRRPALHVPFWLARGPAALFERLPPALLTRDQLRMLEGPDNVVSDGGASMRRLGLGDLVPLDEQLRRAAHVQAPPRD
jgi:NADH dehydrogenase